jgi:hypothetical protein
VNASSQESAELKKDPFSRSSAARDSIRSESTTANVLFVGGGVLAVGAAVLAYTTQWKTEKAPGTSLGLEPWLGTSTSGNGLQPSGVGVRANGHF